MNTDTSTPDDSSGTGEPAAGARAAPEAFGARTYEAFAELGRLVLDQPLGQYLQRVADLAAQTLPGVDALSVTLLEDGRARTAAFTSRVSAMLDERQYETGFGPCLDAASSGRTVRVDLNPERHDAEDAYPAFARAARRQGVRGVTSVGMTASEQLTGALNMYSTTGVIGEGTATLARAFSSYAAVALANAAVHASTSRLASQLQDALASRAVIEQAKGILMVTHRLDADAAFDHLSRASQQTNTKLRTVAADVVDRARHGHRP